MPKSETFVYFTKITSANCFEYTYFYSLAQDVLSVEEVAQLLEQVKSSLGSKNYDISELGLIIQNTSFEFHTNLCKT